MSTPVIGIIIYANPDEYPPTVNTIDILAEQGYEVVVIARNQNSPQRSYRNNVKLYRLGVQMEARINEQKSSLSKALELMVFIYHAWRLVVQHHCTLLLGYDMYGFLITQIVTKGQKTRIPIIYHIHDLAEISTLFSLSYWVKRFELQYAKQADLIVFSEPNRALLFHKAAVLSQMPMIIPNYPRLLLDDEYQSLKQTCPVSLKEFREKFEIIVWYQGVVGPGHSLLQAVQSIKQWPDNVGFAIIGPVFNKFDADLSSIAKQLGIQARLLFLPSVSYKEIHTYTVQGDIGLALYQDTSVNQRYNLAASNKFFEYSRAGLVIVTNDSPSFREATCDWSFVFYADPESYSSIGKAVNTAIVNLSTRSSARVYHKTYLHYEMALMPLLDYIQRLLDKGATPPSLQQSIA